MPPESATYEQGFVTMQWMKNAPRPYMGSSLVTLLPFGAVWSFGDFRWSWPRPFSVHRVDPVAVDDNSPDDKNGAFQLIEISNLFSGIHVGQGHST